MKKEGKNHFFLRKSKKNHFSARVVSHYPVLYTKCGKNEDRIAT